MTASTTGFGLFAPSTGPHCSLKSLWKLCDCALGQVDQKSQYLAVCAAELLTLVAVMPCVAAWLKRHEDKTLFETSSTGQPRLQTPVQKQNLKDSSPPIQRSDLLTYSHRRPLLAVCRRWM